MMIAMLMLLAAPGAEQPPSPVPQADEPMKPVTNPGGWVTPADYPPAALRDTLEGVTGFRLTVGPDGLPRRCEIIASSGHEMLDTATCRLLMERARFQTQRDANGVRVGGTYSNRIRWQMPDDYLEQLARSGFQLDTNRPAWPRGAVPDPEMVTLDAGAHYPAKALAERQEGDVVMTLTVDPLGKVVGCAVINTSMVKELDDAACALMRANGKFQPALDSNGKPARSVVPATFNWVLPRADDAAPNPEPPIRKFPMSDAGMIEATVRIGTDGQASDCQYKSAGVGGQMPNPCDSIGGRLRYIPFTDTNGRPVARRITFRTEVKVEDDAAPAAAPAK
ncbi:energy transducer TonB [Sphingopyxis sp. BSN-002]|uniref:energy transducer TonB n=1 Tax=Sphingopyxis sp. BSN-002 TaxID=2911495 RepID=UPI001EDA0D39|nr:energy transducer TonB [Sphingopyxis sp. BSN-002]UKK83904.1 energy transducer TonB [Sphingopyxis sp. BSN-002]